MLYMEQYHHGTLEILRRLRGELDQIGELTTRAAQVIRDGGTVWTSMDRGHMPHYEQAEQRRGNPRLLKNHHEFEPLNRGDMVFTNWCHRDVLAAREKGVYVVCVTSNYQDNEFRPAGFTDITHSNPDGLMLKDVSNAILHSHIPYTQGLVDSPEFPEFTLCPSSTTGSGTVHWLINAELAHRVAHPEAKEADKSTAYLSILTERVESVRDHMVAIRETAVTMTERVLAGGRWFARSIEHPGFETEFNVASGPRIVNWGDWDTKNKKNIMLISAISPAYPNELKLAREKQSEGAYVIGIGPCTLDGVEPDTSLISIANAGFDNLSPESGGVIEIPGRSQSICPTSGIVGNVIQQMINAQWAEEMIRQETVPYFLRGIYQNGGREYNAATASAFERRGY